MTSPDESGETSKALPFELPVRMAPHRIAPNYYHIYDAGDRVLGCEVEKADAEAIVAAINALSHPEAAGAKVPPLEAFAPKCVIGSMFKFVQNSSVPPDELHVYDNTGRLALKVTGLDPSPASPAVAPKYEAVIDDARVDIARAVAGAMQPASPAEGTQS
jgi:hypothetical protein